MQRTTIFSIFLLSVIVLFAFMDVQAQTANVTEIRLPSPSAIG